MSSLHPSPLNKRAESFLSWARAILKFHVTIIVEHTCSNYIYSTFRIIITTAILIIAIIIINIITTIIIIIVIVIVIIIIIIISFYMQSSFCARTVHMSSLGTFMQVPEDVTVGLLEETGLRPFTQSRSPPPLPSPKHVPG